MVTATRALTPTARADDYLSYLEAEWAALPAIAVAWDSWDEAERLDFQMEWPIREDRLATLRVLAADGELTPGQRERLAKLDECVARNRPLLDRLFF